MKKVALYCRVSTTDQNNDTQRKALEEYAIRMNLHYDVFEEVESSRKTRPVKQQLLHKLRNNEYEGIYIYKLDRWARSSTELLLEIQELLNKNITFVSISDNLDFSTASGRLHFQILSAFAEFERSLISDRTKESLRRKKESGVKLGRPFGSKDSAKRETKKYRLREMNKRKQADEERGIFKPIEDYL